MFAVETGQMSAGETGQMPAAETGQMSAVETRKIYSIETGQRPVATVDIWLVSTCTSKEGPESSLTFASELFNARWHEERSCFLEALCCILLMTPCDVDRFCVQHAAKECMQKTPNNYLFSTPECGSSVVNTSKINDFQVLVLVPFWVSFWRCFGSPNGGQGHQKTTTNKTSKT